MARHFPDGDGDQADRREHDAQAVQRIAAARGLPAAEERGGPAAAAVPGAGAAARPARGGGQPRHGRVRVAGAGRAGRHCCTGTERVVLLQPLPGRAGGRRARGPDARAGGLPRRAAQAAAAAARVQVCTRPRFHYGLAEVRLCFIFGSLSSHPFPTPRIRPPHPLYVFLFFYCIFFIQYYDLNPLVHVH